MALPDEVLFEDWRPGHPHERRMVSLTHVPGLYGLADTAGSVVSTWNNGEDPVMIVGVGPDWSVATLMIDQNCGTAMSLATPRALSRST